MLLLHGAELGDQKSPFSLDLYELFTCNIFTCNIWTRANVNVLDELKMALLVADGSPDPSRIRRRLSCTPPGSCPASRTWWRSSWPPRRAAGRSTTTSSGIRSSPWGWHSLKVLFVCMYMCMCACIRFYNYKMFLSGEIGTLDVQDTPRAEHSLLSLEISFGCHNDWFLIRGQA